MNAAPKSTVQTLFQRRRFESDMAEEMRLHIDLFIEDLVRSGVAPVEARRRAQMEFGSVDNAKTDCREARGLRPFDELGQNVRHALRRLRKAPGFTATALATLALCLGANLALFAVIDSVLLRPLPFPHGERLVSVYNTYPLAGVPNDGCSLPNYYERRGQLPAFAGIAAYREGTATVGEAGATEQVETARITPDFFSTLGLGPLLGRAFTEAETDGRNDDVAIVSDAYWRRRLGGDPGALGRKVRVNGLARTVVGVLPPEFGFLSSQTQVYVPLSSDLAERTPRERHAGTSRMVGRLREGTSLEKAQAQVDARNAALAASDPDAQRMAGAGFRSRVVSLRADHVAAVRPALLLVQAGALFLLLIGAVNLVNLLLIRASGRLKELAVRQALGANRRQVVSEVMVETSVLTLAGGLLGLAVGAAGIRLLGALGTDRLPLGSHIAFDVRVAVAALVGALLVGLAMGVPIAWFNLRGFAAGALQSESRGATAGRAAQRLRHGFIVAQTALAFVLLAGAGLLSLSLNRVMAVSPGFRQAGILSGRLALPGQSYPEVRDLVAFTDRLVGELGRQPGVLAAGVATNVPLSGISNKSAATVKGHVQRPGETLHAHYSYSVGGDYFEALGLPLHTGRLLTADDSHRPERACVVDEDFARIYWSDGPGGPGNAERRALGQQLFQGGAAGADAEAFTIVGVVGAVKQAGLLEDQGQGAVYYPIGHRPDNRLYVVARTSGGATGIDLGKVVRSIDPELPLDDVRTMEARINDSLVARRSPALLAVLFSGLALLLTAIGTYGVLSYAVAQRRREIGLRMALGARPEQVRGQFLGLGLRLLATGIAIGLAGAWLTGRAMKAVLFEVPSLHPGTLAATAGILAGVSLVACLIPTSRAARASPMEALTED